MPSHNLIISKVKLYIDDQRDAPDGWVLIRCMEELEVFLEKNSLETVSNIALDGYLERCTGIDILRVINIARYTKGTKLALPEFTFHSSDPNMNRRMLEVYERIR